MFKTSNFELSNFLISHKVHNTVTNFLSSLIYWHANKNWKKKLLRNQSEKNMSIKMKFSIGRVGIFLVKWVKGFFRLQDFYEKTFNLKVLIFREHFLKWYLWFVGENKRNRSYLMFPKEIFTFSPPFDPSNA